MPSDNDCRVLVVDDDAALQYAFRELLTNEGYVVKTVGDPFDALRVLPEFVPHVCILDLSMPKMNGLELLVQIKKKYPQVSTIMITAYGTEEIAVRAIKSGADDYLSKPFSNEGILLTLKNARERVSLKSENRSLREEVATRPGPALLGTSAAIAEVIRVIEQVAQTDVTVLIQGESGTGKELVANALCHRSRRRGRPFVKLNCAALPESLIESELFGYEAGAFTGATGSKKGRFELANGGTIFLDEIGDMTLATQTKVLRVLQEREVERLGGTHVLPVDVRVVCATNKNLEENIKNGSFREDLFYRLNVVRIMIAPLRERPEDIRPLAHHFMETYSARFGKAAVPMPDAILDRMLAYRWPGNVRELENGIARGVVLENLDAVVPPSGPVAEAADELLGDMKSLIPLPYREAKRRVLARFERFYLLSLMERVNQNVSQAAREARMDRKNFWVKLRAHRPPALPAPNAPVGSPGTPGDDGPGAGGNDDDNGNDDGPESGAA
jgi:DNA-binding NtrC family response regulator